jgi:hypothetical protein
MYLTFLMAFCVVTAPAAQVSSTTTATSQDIDFSAFTRETQQMVSQAGYVGLIWWIPAQYFELSAERNGMSPDKAQERFGGLKKYTIVAVAVGKIGVGNVNWFSEPEIRDNIRLRDAEGNSYSPQQELAGDAKGLASIFRPASMNITGSMGQNTQLFFFPAANKMAKPIADPLVPGSFSVVITKLIAGTDQVLEWKLPLTALTPPKYCPVGKERVQANWKYCPWHGVRLDEPAKAPKE